MPTGASRQRVGQVSDRPDPQADYRERLTVIRDALTAELDSAEGAALASVAKQLRETLAELDAMPSLEVSATDELRQRRDQRREAVVDDSPAGGKQRGKRGG